MLEVGAVTDEIDSTQPISSETPPKPAAEPGPLARQVFRPPDFYAKLHGQRVKFTLITGQPVSGDLVGYNSYELLVAVPGRGDVILPKHSILYAEKTAILIATQKRR